jgi:hypothetical protein
VANSNETSNFTGIWNRDNKSDAIKKVADELKEEKPTLGVTSFNKRKKPWGFSDVILTFAIFLFVQVAMFVVFITIIGLDKTLEFFTTPLGLLLSSLSMYATWIGGMWYLLD